MKFRMFPSKMEALLWLTAVYIPFIFAYKSGIKLINELQTHPNWRFTGTGIKICQWSMFITECYLIPLVVLLMANFALWSDLEPLTDFLQCTCATHRKRRERPGGCVRRLQTGNRAHALFFFTSLLRGRGSSVRHQSQSAKCFPKNAVAKNNRRYATTGSVPVFALTRGWKM